MENETIKVAIRIRPFFKFENESLSSITTENDDDRKIIVSKSLKTFQGFFDKIFNQNSTQELIYTFIKPTLDKIKQSYNCTILAYGQTGSGKTYTMFGNDWSSNEIYINKLKQGNKK